MPDGNVYNTLQPDQIFERKIGNIFLSIDINMCLWCLKEPSHQDGSFEYPQHMFWVKNKKIIFNYAHLSIGLQQVNSRYRLRLPSVLRRCSCSVFVVSPFLIRNLCLVLIIGLSSRVHSSLSFISLRKRELV